MTKHRRCAPCWIHNWLRQTGDLDVDPCQPSMACPDWNRPRSSWRVDDLTTFSGVAAATSGRMMSDVYQKRRWTQTDINELRREVAGGANIKSLAASLGREAEEIHRMAERLSLFAVRLPVS